MEIELWYDPVIPTTYVKLNGHWMDREDIYGFLYPVSNYLLQSWLYPTGSWSGLEKQILEIARGEKADVTFYGRETDFSDLKASIEGTAHSLSFHEWNTYTQWQERLRETEAMFREMIQEQKNTQTSADFFPETIQEVEAFLQKQAQVEWIDRIDSPSQLQEAAQKSGTCCEISSEYLQSFSSMAQLEILTRSVRRSADMICCVLEDADNLDLFESYAAQFPQMSYRFCTREALEQELEALYEKYGKPYEAGRRIRLFRNIAEIFRKSSDDISKYSEELRTIQGKIMRGEAQNQITEQLLRKKVYWLSIVSDRMEAVQKNLSEIIDV